MTQRLVLDVIETPIGELALVANEKDQLRAVGFVDRHVRMERYLKVQTSALMRASNPGGLSDTLRAYFAGDLAAMAKLPVAMEGTEFQLSVWNQLRLIPSGETRSYADIARRIGNPAAVRAVGLANGANPIAVVVPCHRVIGSNGSLTGYGGGIERKRWLLTHEARALPLIRVA